MEAVGKDLIKDLLDVAGWPMTLGSAGARLAPAAASDPVVQRSVDAGFVLLGKTTTLGEPIQGSTACSTFA